MKKIIIAIDGYSGTGKTSTAKQVAVELGYVCIDTGAMYRAITWFFLNNKVDISDQTSVKSAISQCKIHFEQSSIFLNGHCVNQEIRKMEINEYVSKISAIEEVREFLSKQQQDIGKSKGVVMEGRDIGTKIFPNAELKIFLTANIEIRAQRRQKELSGSQQKISAQEIRENLKKRDQEAVDLVLSPLKKTKNTIEIDTSNITFEQQVSKIVELAKRKIYDN